MQADPAASETALPGNVLTVPAASVQAITSAIGPAFPGVVPTLLCNTPAVPGTIYQVF